MAKKQIPQQFAMCLDWETTGATWGGDSSIDYQGIAVGIIICKTSDFVPLEKLRIYIKYDEGKYKWSAEAEAIHGISREFLRENGISQEEAAIAVVELIMKYFGTSGKVMIIGHNVEFDRRFMNQLLNSIEFEFTIERQNPNFNRIEVHHVVIDTAALGFVVFGLYKSDLLFNRIGYADRGDHDPLQDAEMTLGTVAIIKELASM